VIQDDRSLGPWDYSNVDFGEPIAAYEKVDAERGSYAWIWTKLRLAAMCYDRKEDQAALEIYREIVETIDASPEKSIAILMMVACHQRLGNTEDALKIREAAKTLPDMYWRSSGRHADFTPRQLNADSFTGHSHEIWENGLRN
jgi:hypothetical protein